MELVLDIKEIAVLSVVVSGFTESGLPVSSAYIARHTKMPMSPATARNICQKLADYGLLEKPHSHSGNIPTTEGIRFFVENILSGVSPSNKDKSGINRIIERDLTDTYSYLIEMGEFLSFLVKQLGLIVIIQPRQIRLHRLDAVPLSSDKISLIVILDDGSTRSIVFDNPEIGNMKRLLPLVQILNERLHGLTLDEIRRTIDQRLRDIRSMQERFIDLLIGSSGKVFKEPKASRKLFPGEGFRKNFAGILPDVSLLENAIEHSGIVDEAVEQSFKDPGRIRFQKDSEQNLYLVCSDFKSTDTPGIIGFVGSVNLPYTRIVPIIRYASTRFTKLLTNERE